LPSPKRLEAFSGILRDHQPSAQDDPGRFLLVISSSYLFVGVASYEALICHLAADQLRNPHVWSSGSRFYFEIEVGQPGFRNLEATDIGRVKVKGWRFQPSLVDVLPTSEGQMPHSVVLNELDRRGRPLPLTCSMMT
jgi:hypothetical protein